MRVILEVERSGQAWLVKHNGGFLGAVATLEEADALVRDLCACLASMGREAQVVAAQDRPMGRADVKHAA